MIQIIGDFELKIRYKTKISYKYKDLKDYKKYTEWDRVLQKNV